MLRPRHRLVPMAGVVLLALNLIVGCSSVSPLDKDLHDVLEGPDPSVYPIPHFSCEDSTLVSPFEIMDEAKRNELQKKYFTCLFKKWTARAFSVPMLDTGPELLGPFVTAHLWTSVFPKANGEPNLNFDDPLTELSPDEWSKSCPFRETEVVDDNGRGLLHFLAPDNRRYTHSHKYAEVSLDRKLEFVGKALNMNIVAMGTRKDNIGFFPLDYLGRFQKKETYSLLKEELQKAGAGDIQSAEDDLPIKFKFRVTMDGTHACNVELVVLKDQSSDVVRSHISKAMRENGECATEAKKRPVRNVYCGKDGAKEGSVEDFHATFGKVERVLGMCEAELEGSGDSKGNGAGGQGSDGNGSGGNGGDGDYGIDIVAPVREVLVDPITGLAAQHAASSGSGDSTGTGKISGADMGVTGKQGSCAPGQAEMEDGPKGALLARVSEVVRQAEAKIAELGVGKSEAADVPAPKKGDGLDEVSTGNEVVAPVDKAVVGKPEDSEPVGDGNNSDVTPSVGKEKGSGKLERADGEPAEDDVMHSVEAVDDEAGSDEMIPEKEKEVPTAKGTENGADLDLEERHDKYTEMLRGNRGKRSEEEPLWKSEYQLLRNGFDDF